MFLSASLSAIADQPLRALAPSGLVRGVLGLLLLSAAGLKAHAFWSETAQPIMLLSSPRAQVAIIETEALLGLWLMTGLYVRAARWIALSFFGVLASVSLYLAFLGESSCGCFGRVQVNPWFSFAIDVGAILAPWRWRAQSGSYASSRTALQALLRGVLGTSAMVLLIFATFWIMYDDPWTALARLRGEVITVEPAVSDVGAGVAGEMLVHGAAGQPHQPRCKLHRGNCELRLCRDAGFTANIVSRGIASGADPHLLSRR